RRPRACSLAWIGQRPPEPLTWVRTPAGPYPPLELRPSSPSARPKSVFVTVDGDPMAHRVCGVGKRTAERGRATPSGRSAEPLPTIADRAMGEEQDQVGHVCARGT